MKAYCAQQFKWLLRTLFYLYHQNNQFHITSFLVSFLFGGGGRTSYLQHKPFTFQVIYQVYPLWCVCLNMADSEQRSIGLLTSILRVALYSTVGKNRKVDCLKDTLATFGVWHDVWNHQCFCRSQSFTSCCQKRRVCTC